jgi:hypothetical protein
VTPERTERKQGCAFAGALRHHVERVTAADVNERRGPTKAAGVQSVGHAAAQAPVYRRLPHFPRAASGKRAVRARVRVLVGVLMAHVGETDRTQIFSVIVLGTVASLTNASTDTCDLYRTISFPSYGFNPVFVSTASSPNGNMAVCNLGISAGVIGLVVGLVALIDALRLLRGRVQPIDRPAAVYVIEWVVYLIMMILWCVTAIFLALGYVSTCNGSVCNDAVNKNAWSTQAVALTAVVFAWLSLMPWASDFGLITREYFRRINYHRQLKEAAGGK